MARLTYAEAARQAQVSDRTIRRWVAEGSLPAVETPDGRGGSERLIEEVDLLRRLSRPEPDMAGHDRIPPETANGRRTEPEESAAAPTSADVIDLAALERAQEGVQAIVDTAVQRAMQQALADGRERDQAHAAQVERLARELGQQVTDAERRAALAEAEAARLRTELDSRTRTDTDGRSLWRRLLGLE